MKKIILLTLILLSGFANATRIYDHVSGFFSRGANSERFSLGFLATYTITENNITKHYVGVYSEERYGRAFDEWELGSKGVINKVKSYNFTNSQGLVEQIGFIAMNGGLYMVRYLDDHPQPPRLIREVSGDGYDVINVLKTTFGFVIVVNKKGLISGDSTELYNLKFTRNGEYKLCKSGNISLTITTSAECDHVDDLVLATRDNEVLILRTSSLTDYNSSWYQEKKIFGRTNERFMVLPNTNTLSSIVVVKFSTESHHWYINNHILASTDFTNFTDGEDNPRYFDYAVSNVLSDSIQATITNDSKIKSVNDISRSNYTIHKLDFSDFDLGLISVSPLYYGMNYLSAITAFRTSVIYLIKEEGSERYKAFVINFAAGQERQTSLSYEFPS